ncbi:MAG: MarC family protein [Nitrososphaeraceae archaeon]
MGTRFYFLSILISMGLYLSAIVLASPNASYGESSCESTVEYMVDNCNKTPIIADTGTLLITLTDGVITKPIQLMSEFLNEFGNEVVKAVITLFVVIDPIGIIPLFASYTEKMQTKDRKSVSQTATITAGVLLFVFAIAGTQIFAILGIEIFSFMIAGGILLLIVSIELLTHGAWRFGGDARTDGSGVVPLAFPLLAGPGAITSVIISYQTSGIIVTILSIAIVIAITYLILLLADPIYRFLGKRGSMVVTRVFAVIVAAFAVQYIVEGVKQIYVTLL